MTRTAGCSLSNSSRIRGVHQRVSLFVCAVPAAAVVGEAMVVLVLADAFLEKFGGDAMSETRRNFDSYVAYLTERGYGGR